MSPATESTDLQDEPQKVLEAQGQNISLWQLFGQTQGNNLEETMESTRGKSVSAGAAVATLGILKRMKAPWYFTL